MELAAFKESITVLELILSLMAEKQDAGSDCKSHSFFETPHFSWSSFTFLYISSGILYQHKFKTNDSWNLKRLLGIISLNFFNNID